MRRQTKSDKYNEEYRIIFDFKIDFSIQINRNLVLPSKICVCMKNGSLLFIISILSWLFCLSNARADNFSLILGYKLIINQTEIKISQVESQPLTANTVEIEVSNNEITIRDTANRALLFSAESDDYQILELFKKSCLDNLANANCLDEFIEKFYTLFDPFGFEYQFYSGDNLILARLVKENSSDLKSYFQTGILYLQSTEKLIGPVMVYDISSGQKVFSANIKNNESSLDLSCLKRGNYVLVCREKKIKFNF